MQFDSYAQVGFLHLFRSTLFQIQQSEKFLWSIVVRFGCAIKNVRSDLPILVQVGEADPIGGEYSNKALVKAYQKKAGIRDFELFVYHDARHEIYNELNKEDILQDLIKSMNIRIG